MNYGSSIVEASEESSELMLARFIAAGPHKMKRDVYDALDLSTEATGGLAAWGYFDYSSTPPAPACIYGHAGFLDGTVAPWVPEPITPILKELRRLGLPTDGAPDVAIERASRRNAEGVIRAPFAAVMKQLNIVRGEK